MIKILSVPMNYPSCRKRGKKGIMEDSNPEEQETKKVRQGLVNVMNGRREL